VSAGVRAALDDVRVLEVGDASGEYAGRLLAGLGADVVRVEPPAGAPSRRVGPFAGDAPDPDRSLHFWHYNVGKRSAVVDLETDAGRALLARLARRFDVILAAGAFADLVRWGLADGAALRAEHPATILVTLTPFGLDGPWRDRPATDLTLMALGGTMAVSGYGSDDPPLTCAGWQAWQTASVYAVHGLLGALLARDASGDGQDVEVSAHEAATSITEWHLPQALFTGQVSPRAVLGLQFPAKDGVWVSTIVPEFFGPHILPRLAEITGDAGLVDPALATPEGRPALQARIAASLARYCAANDADTVYRAGQRAGFPWGTIRTPDEPLDDAHLHDRGFWVPVRHEDLGRDLFYAGGPFVAERMPWRVARRPPRLGEHTAEVLAEAGVRE
jgi:crotonobetainyl-CoA:carnitine CoA-transferase CaiB-like acyl-CoA transferase